MAYGTAVDDYVPGRVAAGRDRVVEIVAKHRQKPVPGLKLAVIAMVVALLKIGRGAVAQSAVDGVRMGR